MKNVEEKSKKPIEQTLTEILVKNSKNLVIAGVVFVVAAIGYGVSVKIKKNADKKNFSELFKVEKLYQDIAKKHFEELEKSKDSKKTDKVDLPKDEKVQFEKLASITQGYEQLIAKHEGAKVALSAAVALSSIYKDYDKYDKASEVIDKVSSSVKPADGPYFGLILMNQATLKMLKNDYKTATASLEKILADKASEYLHADALVKKGVALQSLNDIAGAEASFIQASEKFSSTEAGKKAKSYLRLLALKKAQSPKAN